ncbi:5-formyltetrahydrofolate cyclo-ligase [Lysinibacillus sp. BW-2-10]|uniref:5-formyltetrahydrofolate cyclo-ligase n=1 Tax=Lysinibacillus sp. BW-2-10 TaxID=2590030 RepID=UPI00351AFF6D
MNMDKKELRNDIRVALSRMSDELYKQSSLLIKKRLLNEPIIIEGNSIAITISTEREVDTIGIIESLWALDKNVLVPKCIAKTRAMEFYKIDNFDQLETVYMNLREPVLELTERFPAEQIDCIIVPGIVFDYSGYRIGYGGGYYDRYLEHFQGNLVSLAFDIQIVNSVPYEAHDQPVNYIITETNRIDCTTKRKG